MGTRVEYWPCPASGPVEELVQCAPAFRDWYASDYAEDGCTDVLQLAEALAQRGSEAFATCTPETTDRLAGEFYGFFVKHRPLPLPARNVRYYRDLLDAMDDTVSSDVVALIRFILIGRPVAPQGRLTPFHSDDDASWVSWWTLAEVRLLRAELPQTLPSGLDDQGVLAVIHEALDLAHAAESGLVITAF